MLSIVIDNLSKNKLIFWGIVLLNMLAFLLVGIASYVTDVNKYNKESINQILSYGINNSGIVSEVRLNADDDPDKVFDLKNDLMQLDEIEYIGNYWYAIGTGEYLAPLAEIENRYERLKGSQVPDNATEYLNMDYSLLGFSELNVADGYSFEEIEGIFDDNTRVIYLGANLSDIPVGTVFELTTPNGTVARREYVAGVLAPDSYWPAEKLTSEGDFLPVYEKVCLDNIYVVLNNSYSYSTGFPWYYSPSKGYTLQEAENAVVKTARESGIEISTDVFSDAFEEKNRVNESIINYAMGMFAVILITTSIIVTCNHVNTIVLKSRDFGVLYSCGYTRLNTVLMLCAENLIRLAVSFVLSALSVYSVIMFIAQSYQTAAKQVYIRLFFSNTVWVLCLVMLAMLVLGTVIPALILYRKPPVDLLKNRI